MLSLYQRRTSCGNIQANHTYGAKTKSKRIRLGWPNLSNDALVIAGGEEQGRGEAVKERSACRGYSDQADIVGARNILARFTSGQYRAAFQT